MARPRKQILPVPFRFGLQTGDDPLVAAGLAVAKNAVYPRGNAIAKRSGQALSAETFDDNAHLHPFGDAAAVIGADGAQLYDPGNDALIGMNKDTFSGGANAIRSLDVETTSRLVLGNTVASPDRSLKLIDYGAGTDFFAIASYDTDSIERLRLRVYDTSTGVALALVTLSTSAANTAGARLLRIGATLYVYYNDGLGNLWVDTVSRSGVSGSPAQILTGTLAEGTGPPRWDACNLAAGSAIVHTRTNGNIELIFLPTGVPAGGSTTVTETPANGPTGIVGLYALESKSEAVILWIENGTTWDCLASIWNTSGVNTSTKVTWHALSKTAFDAPISLAGIGDNYSGAFDGVMYVCYPEVETVPTQNPLFHIKEESLGGGGTDQTYWGKLATKPWPIATNHWGLGIYAESWGWEDAGAGQVAIGDRTQATFYWATTGSALGALGVSGTSFLGRAVDVDWPTAVYVEAGKRPTCALAYLAAGIRTEDVTDEADIGIATLGIDVAARPSSIEHDGSLYVAGALPLYSDGGNIFEQGWLNWPHPIHVIAGGAGAKHPQGTYQFVLVYAHTDLRGKMHRSRPTPVRFTVAVGAGGATYFQIIAPLPVTLRGALEIEVYRTETDGTTPYLAAVHRIVGAPWYSARNVLISETGPASADISKYQPLYTDGGVLSAVPAVPYRHATLWKGRPAILHREAERTDIRYARKTTTAEAFFPPQIRAPLNAEAGTVKALEGLNDRLIAWTDDQIWAREAAQLAGDDGAGENASDWYQLSPAVGCDSAATIVRVPQGIIFLYRKRFWLLGLDGAVRPIGDAVRHQTETLTIVSGHRLDADQHVAVWITDGEAIVYDWLRDQWSTWDNHAALSGAVVDGKLLRLETGGFLWAQDAVLYEEGGSHYGLQIATNSIQLAGLGGDGHLYELLVIGYNVGPAKMLVEIAYNGDPSWRTLTAFDLTTLAAFAASEQYGAGLALGTYGDQAMVLRFTTHRLLVTSFRVRITEQQEGANFNTKGFELVGLGVHAGVMPGALFRPGEARQLTG